MPSLLSLLLTVFVLFPVVAYFAEIDPFRTQINDIMSRIANLFAASSHSIAVAVHQTANTKNPQKKK
jgi:hypothetical protein